MAQDFSSPTTRGMINLANVIRDQYTPQQQALFDQKINLLESSGVLAAENARVEAQGKLDAADATRKYADSVDLVNTITAKTQDYLQTSEAARQAHAMAAGQLNKLNEQASVSFFDSPLQWLGNQITFEDDYRAAQVAVAASNSKTAEATTLRDDIINLNNMTQEVAQTNMALAVTSNANTVANTAALMEGKYKEESINAQIEKLRTGADLQIKGYQLALGARDQEIQEERLALEKQRLAEEKARRLKAEKDESAYIASVYNDAILGMAKLQGVDVATARARIGTPPKSIAELNDISKRFPQFAAAVEVGGKVRWNDPAVYGSSPAQAAMTLVETNAQGNAVNKLQVDTLKALWQQGLQRATSPDPKKRMAEAEAFVNSTLESMAKKGPEVKGSIFRLPAPATVLQGGFDVKDPRTAATLEALKKSPLVQNMLTSGVLAQDDPSKVLEHVATWSRQNKMSPTEAARVYTELYNGAALQHSATLSELGIPTKPLVEQKYSTPVGTIFGGAMGGQGFSPLDPKRVQELIVSAQVEAARAEQATQRAQQAAAYFQQPRSQLDYSKVFIPKSR